MQIGKPGQGNHIGGANVGILLASSESYVAGNHIGVNPAGNQARPNNYGIIIPGSVSDGTQALISSTGRKNIIGGTPDENGELQQGENIIAGNRPSEKRTVARIFKYLEIRRIGRIPT